MEGDQPGVQPTAPVGTAQTPTPTGSETVTNPGGGQGEQAVPYARFHEVNEKAKADAARAEKAEKELEEFRQQQQSKTTTEEDEEIDPNVENLVTKIIEKKGYVKKEDLQASEIRQQYQKDVATLTDKYASSGVPFVEKDIRDYAKANGISITSKASLEAAYKDMNFDKILEGAKNSAITDFKEGRNTQGEKPGSSGTQPEDKKPEVRGLKNRVHAAAQKLKS